MAKQCRHHPCLELSNLADHAVWVESQSGMTVVHKQLFAHQPSSASRSCGQEMVNDDITSPIYIVFIL